ncbi:hypothetical protein HN803_01000 [candidate division WWE3 bacterium]|nr:hypothetical protein [candidate division WWE3 bacterium]MBT7349352.1 hypothetical protein [candidate division WWE3 bacterium]
MNKKRFSAISIVIIVIVAILSVVIYLRYFQKRSSVNNLVREVTEKKPISLTKDY